jgi:predicted dehydrogenase
MIGTGLAWGPVFDTGSRYMIDAANGATLLSIPMGHSIDALAMTLGDVTDVRATLATRRHEVHHAVTGETATMTAPDQVALTATLESGAVAVAHMRGGITRATNFRWEINGTDGDIVVEAPPGVLWWMSHVTIRGVRGAETELTELPVPARYERVLAGRSNEPAYNVAHAYTQLHEDITTGTNVVPDFAHATRLHRLLEDVATSGRRDQ